MIAGLAEPGSFIGTATFWHTYDPGRGADELNLRPEKLNQIKVN